MSGRVRGCIYLCLCERVYVSSVLSLNLLDFWQQVSHVNVTSESTNKAKGKKNSSDISISMSANVFTSEMVHKCLHSRRNTFNCTAVLI